MAGKKHEAGHDTRYIQLQKNYCFVCGKVNQLRHVVAVTSEMTVNYLKPVPLKQPLRVESREVKVTGRKHINMAEILNEKGEVLARSQGLFIAIDPHRMFARFVER